MQAPDAPALAPASPTDTARALSAGAVLRWWQATVLVEASGPDAVTLLDGLCTQAVDRVAPGSALPGLFLDAKAKILAPALIHRLPEAPWTDPRRGDVVEAAPRLLLETLPECAEVLVGHLTRYRLRAKVTLAPAADLGVVAVVGTGAAHAAATLGAGDAAAAGAWTQAAAGHARPTWSWIGPLEACGLLVAEAAAGTDLPLADPDALEADRIEHGIAGLHDLLPGRMPAEVGGMVDAVALDAGCYLGQEPVVRLHYRGKANRTLRRLTCAYDIVPRQPDDALAPGDASFELHREGAAPGDRPVGRLTTWARSATAGSVALAVLRREVEAGTSVRLAGTDTLLRVHDDPSA